jgi:hypothetical protein
MPARKTAEREKIAEMIRAGVRVMEIVRTLGISQSLVHFVQKDIGIRIPRRRVFKTQAERLAYEEDVLRRRRESSHQSYLRNKEKVNRRSRERERRMRGKEPEHFLARRRLYSREHYRRNRDRALAYGREYRKKNRPQLIQKRLKKALADQEKLAEIEKLLRSGMRTKDVQKVAGVGRDRVLILRKHLGIKAPARSSGPRKPQQCAEAQRLLREGLRPREVKKRTGLGMTAIDRIRASLGIRCKKGPAPYRTAEQKRQTLIAKGVRNNRRAADRREKENAFLEKVAVISEVRKLNERLDD